MLACIQRRRSLSYQRLLCTPKVLEPAPLASAPPPQTSPRKHSPPRSRYPSAAELDAFARQTSRSPLSIRIFPCNVRVPQHRQVGRTVNGLDPSHPPYAHGGYQQGLLAVVEAPVLCEVRGGGVRRTKHSPGRTAAAAAPPYGPLGGAGRPRPRPHRSGSCRPGPAAAPAHVAAVTTGGGQGDGHAPLPRRRVARRSHGQAGGPPSGGGGGGGGARVGPPSSLRAAALCSDAAAVAAETAAPQSGSPAHSGVAAPPAQSTDVVAKATDYQDAAVDYGMWQRQHYQQGALGMYGGAGGNGASPETLSYGPRPLSAGASGLGAGGGAGAAGLEQVGSPPPPLNGAAANHGAECSAGRYFALVAPDDSDRYASRELLPRPGLHPHPPHPQPLCHASLLSGSLRSLESLIGQIRPPCIKERMLGGRGYDAAPGMPRPLDRRLRPLDYQPRPPLDYQKPRPLDHQQQQQHGRHSQPPVFR